MKFLCFGTGAIGTYIGGSLALHGEDVVFLDRPENVDWLRQNGLSLSFGEKKYRLKDICVVGSLEDAYQSGPFDAAIFALKSFDTRKAAMDLIPYQAALPPILCLQNGIENEVVLAETIGSEKIIHGTITSAIGKTETGSIKLEKLRGVGISSRHAISEKLAFVFDKAELRPRLFDQPIAMKWSKMLTNILANATSAILNWPPKEIYDHKGIYLLEKRMLKEALDVMKELNLSVINLPGTPVRMLVDVLIGAPTWVGQPLLRGVMGSGRGKKMPSFHIDLYAGRKQSEVDYLNGAIVRAGEKVNVATPVNLLLTQTLLGLTEGRIDKNEFAGKPEKLISLVSTQERTQP